jgi:hypothetical protein
LADKLTQLLLDALGKAAAEPAGLPLFGGKTGPGLFPATAVARQAAQRGQDDGYLRGVATESAGKADQVVCAITEKGLEYLLQQTSPRQVLEDFVRAVEARREQVGELIAAARRMQTGLDALHATVAQVLPQVATPGPDWSAEVPAMLTQWRAAGASEDCPLPELFARLRRTRPELTTGQFHDGLRKLHDDGLIYLHPWTGPLYALPDPVCALLVGHEIAYYASARAAAQAA